MKVFVAGATGAIGRRLVPILERAAYQVIGATRTPAKAAAIRAAGGEAVVMDALNPASVMQAIQAARPDVVVHQLTAIPAHLNVRKFDRDFSMTNRPRTAGMDAAELEEAFEVIPRDREIVLQLRNLVITRIRPLAGGLAGWRGRGFPLQALELGEDGSNFSSAPNR